MERGGEGESREGRMRAPYFFPSSANSFAMNRATTQRRHIFKGFSVATLPKENDRSDQKKDLVGNSSHLIQQFPEEDQGLISETKTKKLERRCSFFFSTKQTLQ
jgi:hypothetical protein